MNKTEFRTQVAAEILANEERLAKSNRVVDRSAMARSATEALLMARVACRNEAAQLGRDLISRSPVKTENITCSVVKKGMKQESPLFKLGKSDSADVGNYQIVDANGHTVRNIHTNRTRAEKIVVSLNTVFPALRDLDTFELNVVIDTLQNL